jgi:hypothetical protein
MHLLRRRDLALVEPQPISVRPLQIFSSETRLAVSRGIGHSQAGNAPMVKHAWRTFGFVSELSELVS